jgi:hypothetical protein
MRRVSRKVRKDVAAKGSSGWSVKASGPDAGKVAKDAYMVALPKEQVESPVSNAPSTAELRAYQTKHAELLSEPRAYHGGWIPGGGKQGVQDVSTEWPRSQEGALKDAAREAILHEQEGIGVVNKRGGFEGTINMPRHFHLSVTQFPTGGVSTEPTISNKGNMVSITPSAYEMLDTGASWVAQNAQNLMKDEAIDPSWQETKNKDAKP